jgi:predicted TIM-barrel fold metal-dependent hydrolase
MKYKKNSFVLLFLFLGITLIIFGFVFSPEVVAKYVKKVEVLPHYTVTKVTFYQIYSLCFGFLIVLLSVFLLKKNIAFYLIFPVLFLFLLSIHNVYINRVYPYNIFLKKSELVKPWRVFLGKDIVLKDFQPKSGLSVKNENVTKGKYPVIDIHFHLDSMEKTNREDLIKAMDTCGVNAVVHLLGAPRHIETFKKDYVDKYPGRFILFSTFDLHEIADSNKNESDFPKREIAKLENAIKMGARGVKVYKSFGLKVKDKSGRLMAIDDPRYDPIWDKTGELGVPIMIHIAEPTAFWLPPDRFNERYEELRDSPEISLYGPQFPKKEILLLQVEHLIKKHPKTKFIMAHMGMSADNLVYLSHMMDTYSNYYVDTASTLQDLGRQPYTARKFIIKYQDRILFGSDGGYGLDPKGLWSPEIIYRTYFEFFETSNEYFEYPIYGTYNQGNWRIYGIDLPNEVLEKLYHKNAEKLLFKG